jgi:hypothetical protein
MCVTALNERDSMALRVDCSEPLTFVIETKNFACLNAVSLQITLKAGNARSCEADLN